MSDHRINTIRAHLISVPVRQVHSHGSGDVGTIRSVLLELGTASGLRGWGEASPWPVFTGTAEASASAIRDYLAPCIRGKDPVQVEFLMNSVDSLQLIKRQSREFGALTRTCREMACPVHPREQGRFR